MASSAVNGLHAGQNLQPYLRDHWAGILSTLNVNIIPYAKFYGADENTAYLMHSITNEAILCENVDSVVLSLGHIPETALEEALLDCPIDIQMVGDCLSPRSAEEAILEGMQAALKI